MALSPDVRLIVWIGKLGSGEAATPCAARDLIGRGTMPRRTTRAHRRRSHASRPFARRFGSCTARASVSLLGGLDSAAVAIWQAAADVVLNTSSSEGLSFALSEALVSGTRVAAVPVGGIPELLAATSGGTLAADSSPEAVADAIEHELELAPDEDLSRRSAFLLLSNVIPRLADIYSRSL